MRKVISITLLLTFLLLSISGIQLTVPRDRGANPSAAIAKDSGPAARVEEKVSMPFYPKKMHEWAGYIFIFAGFVHVYLNRRPMMAYLRRKL